MELKAEPLPQGCYDSSANVSMKNLVAIPFSRGPSWPRDGSQVSFIAGMFFTTVLPGKSQVHSHSGLIVWDSVTFPHPVSHTLIFYYGK